MRRLGRLNGGLIALLAISGVKHGASFPSRRLCTNALLRSSLRALPTTHNFSGPALPFNQTGGFPVGRQWFSTAAQALDTPVPFTWGSADNDLAKELAASVGFAFAGSEESALALLQHVMTMFHNHQRLPKDIIIKLLDHAIALHRSYPNVLPIHRTRSTVASAPVGSDVTPTYSGNVTVVGDVHGQYEDFASIFESATTGGYPNANNQFVFNGDLVDRGPKGLEIVTTLLLAKTLYPGAVHILKGNHELSSMNMHYGFQAEVLGKYDAEVLQKFRAFFDTLPFAAVIENAYFVTHGGLGPKSVLMTVAQLNELDRFGEPEDGPIAEMLWADPKDNIRGFANNPMRGGGTYLFGADATYHFLTQNNLKMLFRSHEVCMQGFEVLHRGLCATVFSAPNYCGDTGNLGAVIRMAEPNSMQAEIVQFAPAAFLKAQMTRAKNSPPQAPPQ